MTNTPLMSLLGPLCVLAAVTILHLPTFLTILVSVAQYAQPFALLYFKDWLVNRRK